jgi:hypothetical protein
LWTGVQCAPTCWRGDFALGEYFTHHGVVTHQDTALMRSAVN